MKITVGILNWNTAPTLKRALEVLNHDLNHIYHEVFVIDQGSIDNTNEVILEASDNWNKQGFLHMVRHMENVGISKGKNDCIDRCKGDYLLLLDGDIVPVPNSVILMMKWLDENPNCHAIGMYPNRWTEQENKPGQKFYETFCRELYDPKPHNGACLFYGLYRRTIFDDGLRCCEEGALGEPGYGWEDHDFYYEMKRRKIVQYVAHINNPQGHYFHKINSSLKNKDCLGKQHYIDNYDRRKAVYDKRKHAVR